MGWFNHQLELFVVRLLPHIAWGFTTHHFDFLPRLCDLKTHGSRSTMNTWAQWTLWPSVKMENVGCLRLESVTEKHNQTATYWRRWNLQKEPQTKKNIVVGDQWIQSGFQSVMLIVLMLVCGHWALGNSLGDMMFNMLFWSKCAELHKNG